MVEDLSTFLYERKLNLFARVVLSRHKNLFTRPRVFHIVKIAILLIPAISCVDTGTHFLIV